MSDVAFFFGLAGFSVTRVLLGAGGDGGIRIDDEDEVFEFVAKGSSVSVLSENSRAVGLDRWTELLPKEDKKFALDLFGNSVSAKSTLTSESFKSTAIEFGG